jgi:hypothetical protein
VPGARPADDGRPRTDIVCDPFVLEQHKGADRNVFVINRVWECLNKKMMVTLAYLESASRLLADGPKLFRPTEEQWDSMEQVEIHLPIGQFRTPFPALVVQIPPACRQRLAARFAVTPDRMPTQVLIRYRDEPGENSFLFIMSRFGNSELFHIVQDQEGNEDIEDALNRKIDRPGPDNPAFDQRDRDSEYPCSVVLARAVMNLCLMMTHHGCAVGAPLDPHAYARHRSKKHLQHFKYGDYLTVNMKQHVVVRRPAPATNNPPGPGTGIELVPHWRKGHWRAYPGQGAMRAAGHQVQLLFVRPCLVREDRASGELSATETTYHGE